MSAPLGSRREGRALCLGHDVNTDELHPSRFYSLDDETVRSGFLQAVPGRRGVAASGAARIVVAGRNFGIGSSRETGARVFLLAGVQAVVAESYGRIFLRNVINLGLPALICPSLSGAVEEGEHLAVDLEQGVVEAASGEHRLLPLDPLHRAVLEAGGLMEYLGLAT